MNPKSGPLVCVVVLNWNNYEDTRECLSSLLGESYPNLRTIVVDNGSVDNSAFRLCDEFPDVTGYKLLYTPSFLAYHSSEGSHSNHGLKYVYLGYRSKLIMQQRLLPPGFFPVWKLAFRLYARFLARRTWRELRKSTGVYDNNLDEMEFALRKAIADHGKGTVTESTLSRFEIELGR